MAERDNTSSQKEQRTEKRIAARDQFLVEFKRREKARTFNKGYGSDLSLSTVRFTTVVPFAKGDVISMVLHLTPEFPGPQKIEMSGEVVRVQENPGKLYRQVVCKWKEEEPAQKGTLHAFILWVSARIPESGVAEALDYVKQYDGKRAARRVLARDEFLVEYQRGDMGHKGYGCDLSVTGARFITTEPLGIGETIPLAIYFSPQFPGLPHLEVSAKIVRSSHPPGKYYCQVGCEFEDPKGQVRHVLSQFLDWLETKSSA